MRMELKMVLKMMVMNKMKNIYITMENNLSTRNEWEFSDEN